MANKATILGILKCDVLNVTTIQKLKQAAVAFCTFINDLKTTFGKYIADIIPEANITMKGPVAYAGCCYLFNVTAVFELISAISLVTPFTYKT